MRNLLISISLLCSAFFATAQPIGFAPLKDLSTFQQHLAKSTSGLQSLQSDFVQTKNMALLSDKITSKGVFYYRKEDKVRIEYTTPYSYLLVMNAGQVLVKDEQKSTRINAKTSKLMQSVNRVMIDCMRGSVFSNPDFKVTAYESAGNYLLSLRPATASVKGMFSQIDVYLTKATLDVDRLNMAEQGGDFTQMDFKNSKRNLNLSDALFKVR